MSEPDAFPLVSACAVAGNGWQENSMQPLTLGAKDHGSDGLMQWRLGRLTELQRIPGWQTLQVQCRFFKMECKRDFPSLWAQLVNPGKRTIENLTANICDMYERPSAAGRALQYVSKTGEELGRIPYAYKVKALFDTETKMPPPPVPIPASVPQPMAQGIVYILNNFFNGTYSTLIGTAALCYAYLAFKSIHIQGLPVVTDWWLLVVLGVIMLFGMGGHAQPSPEPVADESEPEPEPEPKPVETTMDPLKLISLLEAVIPFIVKEIPTLRAEIAGLKELIEAGKAPVAGADDRIAHLIEQLNAMGPH